MRHSFCVPTNDRLGIKDQVATSLSTLVGLIFSDDGQFTGPLFVALAGLEQYGALPEDVSSDDIAKVATICKMI